MNLVAFNFFKQMHSQVKFKSYSIKFIRNNFLLRILNLLIEYNFINNYLSYPFYNYRIKIFLQYLMLSKPTYHYCVPLSKPFYLYTATRYLLFILKRDFPFGSFLLSSSKGLFFDLESMQSYKEGGHLLAWFA